MCARGQDSASSFSSDRLPLPPLGECSDLARGIHFVPETLQAVMDRRHVRTIVDFTDRELQEARQCVIERDQRSGESSRLPLAVIGMGV